LELLEASVRVFVEALTTRADLRDSVEALASEMLESARRTGASGLERAIETLAQSLPLPPAEEGHVAIVMGALVELGAPPMTAAPALAGMMARVFTGAQAFIAACEDAAEESGTDEVSPELRQTVAQRLPDAAAAETALNQVCLGALSVLTRSAEARELARAQPRLEMRARALAPMQKGARLAWILLSLLEDEDLLVLDPVNRRGWKVHLSGVADNRQLHLLLAGALPGSHSPRPSPEAIAAASTSDEVGEAGTMQSVWTMYQWRALHLDGSLPHTPETIDPARDLVTHLGVPSQIEVFEGARVLLLGPPLEVKTWNANRIFYELHGGVKILETLTPEAVRSWLARITAAAT
jgi:hypothetical protein